MRRAGLAILAAAALLAGAAPAWSGDEGRVAPVAELSVSPESVGVGDPVALDASGSRDSDGSVTSYAWDLDGDGSYERQSGSQATLAHAFERAGEHSIGVRVIDDSGESADATTTVVVAEARPEPAPELKPEPAAAAEPEANEPAQGAEPAERTKPKRTPEADTAAPSRAAGTEQRVSAAASQTVSVRDFSFAPRSVSVNVGDTITFRNTGDEPHTATARNGSFDTGNIASGASGSVTLRTAGTFSYFCKPHPFMTGTVTVTGGGGGGGSGGGGSGGGGGGSGGGDPGDTPGVGGDTAGDGGSLPSTGLAIAPFLAIGLLMVGSGAALRRQCAAPTR